MEIIILLLFILYPNNNDSTLCHALSLTTTSSLRSRNSIIGTLHVVSKSSEWQPQEYQQDVDQIQQGLCSPAPESYRVIQKAVHQLNLSLQQQQQQEEFNKENVNDHYLITNVFSLSYLIKRNYQLQLLRQQSSTKYKNSYSWNVIQNHLALTKNNTNEDHSIVHVISPTNYYDEDHYLGVQNVLDLSRKALQIAATKDFMNCESKNKEVDDIVKLALDRIIVTEGTDLRGRLSADAAFNFGMAGIRGIQGKMLLDRLLQIATKELKRKGHRASFPTRHMIEKFASVGALFMEETTETSTKSFLSEVASNLVSKPVVVQWNSDSSLLWLWRFSKRQPKPVVKDLMSLPFQRKFSELFEDPNKPLIIDIGCGMGVSILGLATTTCTTEDHGLLPLSLPWSEYNYLGIDTNPLFVGYGNGLASRWGLSQHVQFISAPAQSYLENVVANEQHTKKYPGQIQLIMIQFPTPYQLSFQSKKKNDQLPKDAHNGFLFTPALCKIIQKLLSSNNNSNDGYLLLQSNCEDVAIHMREIVETMDTNSQVTDFGTDNTVMNGEEDTTIPKRTKQWLQYQNENYGPKVQRARGNGWSNRPILPLSGRTETEIFHMKQNTPIHRCLFSFPPVHSKKDQK